MGELSAAPDGGALRIAIHLTFRSMAVG